LTILAEVLVVTSTYNAKFDRLLAHYYYYGDGSKSRNVAAVAVQKWLDTVILFLQNFMY
jgi:hypothetical protein